MTAQTPPTGRLIRKHHRQVVRVDIAPPMRGPEAAAMAHAAPMRDVHFARSLRLVWLVDEEGRGYRSETMSDMMMFTRPIIPPPPTPWITREAMSMFMF